MKPIKDTESKKQKEKDINEKVGLFNRLPDHCVACEKDFDRKNREMVSTWIVVVREKQNIVNLYCPECIDMARKIIKDFENK
mgnify:CR=1 FL=1